MSTCPIELNDDGAADPASDSAGLSSDLAPMRNSCNGLNKKDARLIAEIIQALRLLTVPLCNRPSSTDKL